MVCLLLHIHRRTTQTQFAFETRRQGNWLVVPYDNFFEVNLVFCHAKAVLMIIIHIIFGTIWILLSSPVSPSHYPLLEHLDRSSALLDSKRAYYATTPRAQSVRRHTGPRPVTVSAGIKKTRKQSTRCSSFPCIHDRTYRSDGLHVTLRAPLMLRLVSHQPQLSRILQRSHT
ncbi:uncharacterized protein F5891DRAFT_599449 [Suillus fuscotomentosus]|uniref:Uncharacterized protein n=1 Tax=Suillus fuscotomentosus TaxID=1912939 RepID=A0AAD4DYL9_9AGAM|nr:uncharacterized protein F5891DRAFT_599449 [Suillus fuscotomentosus]KAG1896347.1 hypothetical protein F5891DRAFT_599449 [Suillus fuscotomentosus]